MEALFIAAVVQAEEGSSYIVGFDVEEDADIKQALAAVDAQISALGLKLVSAEGFGSTQTSTNGTNEKKDNIKEMHSFVVRKHPKREKNTDALVLDKEGNQVYVSVIEWYEEFRNHGNGKFFGRYRTVSQYLNDDQDIKTFEKMTNMTLADCDVYNGEGAPTRKADLPTPCEYKLENPVKVEIYLKAYTNDRGEAKTAPRFSKYA